MTASVLVPIRNEIAHIDRTVDGLLAQDFAEPVEFLLIDGDSTDGTRERLTELMARDPRLRVLRNPARTIPAALNRGLHAATGEFIVRMDAHTRYPPEYVRLGVERVRRGDVASASGSALPAGGGRWSRRVALALGTWLGTGGPAFRYAVDDEVDVPSGFTGVWRRDTIERCGGWDERWPVNEDAEMAARVRALGGRIVCVPAMAAEYAPRDGLRALAAQYGRYGFYRAKTARRHPDTLRLPHLLPPAVVATTLGAGVPGVTGRACRGALVAYLTCVAGTAARAAGGVPVRDVLALPVVLVTMHLSWGGGYLAGAVRFRALRRRAVAAALREALRRR